MSRFQNIGAGDAGSLRSHICRSGSSRCARQIVNRMTPDEFHACQIGQDENHELVDGIAVLSANCSLPAA